MKRQRNTLNGPVMGDDDKGIIERARDALNPLIDPIDKGRLDDLKAQIATAADAERRRRSLNALLLVGLAWLVFRKKR